MILLNKQDEFIDTFELNKVMKYIFVELLSQIPYKEETMLIEEDKIKYKIKQIQRQLDIIKQLLTDDITGNDNIYNKDFSLSRYKYLDQKEIEDGIRYLVVEMYKRMQNLEVHKVNEVTDGRIRRRIKTVYKHILEIKELLKKEE